VNSTLETTGKVTLSTATSVDLGLEDDLLGAWCKRGLVGKNAKKRPQ